MMRFRIGWHLAWAYLWHGPYTQKFYKHLHRVNELMDSQ